MYSVRPLSDMQQSMLVHEMLEDRPMYTMPLCFRIAGPLDAPALERALHRVIRRHPALAATFEDGCAVPLGPSAPLPALTRDSGAPAAGDVPGLLTDWWDTPFDLTVEPPVRARLVSGPSGGVHHLALAVHHVAGDSWSLALLADDLGQAYAAELAGADPTGTAPDFFDHAERENAAPVDTTWWKEQLEGVRCGAAPRTSPPGEADHGTFLVRDLPLGAAETRAVRLLSRACQVSPAVVLFTVVSAVVAGSGPEHDVVVGMPTALRDSQDLQNTVGPLLNTLPVRTRWPDRLPPAQVVERHARSIDAALDHKDVPYSRILRAAAVHGAHGAAPLFLHLVNVDTVVPRLRLPALRTTHVPVPPRWANFPALWEFGWGTVGNIRGTLRASADAFTEQDTRHLRDAFRDTVARFTSDLR
ncbi:condensation domain-containing protein [Streptomyces fuscichromogenes]|uniref:condensation domain-containing protein n=1 Tax=Streptomyces fuscichromogenes TaxID=1324013 RepID=UPI00382F7AA9